MVFNVFTNICLLVNNPKKITISFGTQLSRGTRLEGYNVIEGKTSIKESVIGRATYIASNCTLPYSKIGKFCSIASNVEVIIGTHPTDWVSTHPSFYSSLAQANFTFRNKSILSSSRLVDEKYSVVVGNDVWIGSHVKILNGITIGDGAIIATGAVVTKDVEPYSIVGGVPSKLLRYRFSEEDIKYLQKLCWFDWEMEKIEEYYHYFSDVSLLRKKLGNNPEMV
ncbi:CatB-related O-acetyltransferase [Streptococcus acidominimus]|uniref:CatB-related O-acetyltransferase n=1 Tax=Streptococcus acidominimus TaxID=1326 RepID=UPI001F57AD3F|nr:CatB-related O-acetyltransferase [Streptococcus acidominimus]